MTALRRPWTERIYDLLADGPIEREQLIEQTIAWVPQGHAYRAREQQRAHSNARSVPLTDRRARPARRSATELHRIGARLVVVKAIRQLIRNGKLVHEGSYYRLPDSSASSALSARESA
jgi:hypothetical protein